MEIGDWLGLGGLVLGGGIVVKVLIGLWKGRDAHRDAHRETTASLARGEVRFASLERKIDSYREMEDRRHNALDQTVGAMKADTAEIKGVVKEILVALNERKPGQGMNGDRK